jgi:hypothetical protein
MLGGYPYRATPLSRWTHVVTEGKQSCVKTESSKRKAKQRSNRNNNDDDDDDDDDSDDDQKYEIDGTHDFKSVLQKARTISKAANFSQNRILAFQPFSIASNIKLFDLFAIMQFDGKSAIAVT